jgi:hypothetical protein
MPRKRDAAPDLMALRERIDRWRSHRQGRSMPAELWEGAAAAARRFGVSYVATALGLGYAPLKSRVESSTSQAPATTAFVELTGAELLSPVGPSEVTIRLSRGDAQMTIVAPVVAGLDLATLVSAFTRA